jgi:hypothetical protein
MDYLYMLRMKLTFLRFFYATTSEPFETAMRHIKEGRPPYDQFGNDEGDDSEPPFTTEWIEFNDGLRTLGNVTLSLVTVVFQEYLVACAFKVNLGQPPTIKKAGWFERYRQHVKSELDIDMDDLGADMGLLHEMILARNCILHPADIGTNWVHQNAEYARKYPQANFADQSYAAFLQDEEGIAPPAPLEITREKIEKAMDEVEHFGELLDNKLREVPGYF